jgi:5-methylcytosine-specific restriction endonuclease McrA
MWMRRSELKRTKGLKRSAPKPKARIPHNVRRAVYRRQEWRCLVCDGRDVLTLPYLQMHHVLPQQTWPEHDENPFNLVAICAGCHDNHERAHRRIRYDELPEQVRTWIRTLGGRETLYVERTYR